MTCREEMRLPQPRKVIKETEITHEKGLETDDAALRRQRELQQAAVIEYANARLLPTIQDPKIYSVRVRVRTIYYLTLSADRKCRRSCLSPTSTGNTRIDARTTISQ